MVRDERDEEFETAAVPEDEIEGTVVLRRTGTVVFAVTTAVTVVVEWLLLLVTKEEVEGRVKVELREEVV